MLANDLMSRDPAVIPATATLQAAAALMLTRGVGMLPVVDHVLHRELLGVITDRDLVLRQLALGHGAVAKVHEHMTRAPLATVTGSASLSEVGALLKHHKVRRLPVVDEEGCVQGVIGLTDLARMGSPEALALVGAVMEHLSTPGALAT